MPRPGAPPRRRHAPGAPARAATTRSRSARGGTGAWHPAPPGGAGSSQRDRDRARVGGWGLGVGGWGLGVGRCRRLRAGASQFPRNRRDVPWRVSANASRPTTNALRPRSRRDRSPRGAGAPDELATPTSHPCGRTSSARSHGTSAPRTASRPPENRSGETRAPSPARRRVRTLDTERARRAPPTRRAGASPGPPSPARSPPGCSRCGGPLRRAVTIARNSPRLRVSKCATMRSRPSASTTARTSRWP